MPNRAKQKGDRGERAMVQALQALDIHAEKIPLSGAVKGGEFEGDLLLRLPGWLPGKAEVKCRAGAAGWTVIKNWLSTHDFLFLKEDRKEPLVVMPYNIFAQMVRSMKGHYAPEVPSGDSRENKQAHHVEVRDRLEREKSESEFSRLSSLRY
jgi:hypothetical protein